MKVSPTRRHRQRGSSTVEAGLAIPVIFALTFGFIQWAIVLCGYNSTVYAARQAARYAIVHGSTSPSPATTTQLQNIVKQNFMILAPSGNISVTPTYNPDNTPGSTVTIAVQVTYKVVIPFVVVMNVPVGTTCTMTIIQ